jgi:hypothetical protein
MSANPYKVYIVVDREFGEQLAQLERGVPVWIVDTPANKVVAQRLWNERHDQDHLTGITTFNDVTSSPTEDILLARLDAIDLHHGTRSAEPPYTVIEVIGTPLSIRAKAGLSEYGFNGFRVTAVGFVAERPEPRD